MSGQRFSVDASFTPLEFGRRHRQLLNGLTDTKRIRRQIVSVPAGKTALCILDDKALSASTDAKFLGLKSSVEGVAWWPIDSATPSIDPDTRPFGWLLDYAWPDYVHDHGGLSLATVQDHGTTMNPLFDELPSSSSYEEDIAAGLIDFNAAALELTEEEVVSFGGQGFDASGDHTLGSAGRALVWLLGPDSYYNLGTRYDGLDFYLYTYVATAANLIAAAPGCMTMQFSSYPFTTTYPTSYPATTPRGRVPFSATDRNLDRNCYDTLNGGWQTQSTPVPWPNAYWAATAAQLAYPAGNGYSIIRLRKVGDAFGPTYGNSAGTQSFAGEMVWNRTTFMQFNFLFSLDTQARLYNIWFGPQPGKARILRPYELTTDQPWSASSIPAIGTQNPTDEDASIEVVYGGL